jgi:hypothetical protein
MNRREVVYQITQQLRLDYGVEPPWAYKVAALVEGEEIAYLEAHRDDTHRAQLATSCRFRSTRPTDVPQRRSQSCSRRGWTIRTHPPSRPNPPVDEPQR